MAISALPVRGTKDYLPNEVQLRDYIQNTILNTYKKYGFQRINTPIMEDIERLNKSDGGENLSLIFKLLKRGQKLDLTKENLEENDLVDSGLRYDLTMPLSRYFANNRQNLVLPFKCIQVDKVFRAERPQKGRLREFYQLPKWNLFLLPRKLCKTSALKILPFVSMTDESCQTLLNMPVLPKKKFLPFA